MGLPIVILETDSTNPLYFLIDTGSSPSLIQESSLKGHHQYIKNDLKVSAVTGDPVQIEGKLDGNLCIGDTKLGSHRFLIQKNDFPKFQGILGTDWLTKSEAVIDYSKHGVRIKNQNAWIPFWNYTKMGSLGINAIIDQTKTNETMEEYEVVDKVKLNAVGPRKFPALTTGNLEVRWRKKNIPEKAKEVVILCEPTGKIKIDLDGLIIGRALLDGKKGRSYIPYVNVTDQEIYIDKGDVLAIGTILIKRETTYQYNEVEGDETSMDPKIKESLNELKNSDADKLRMRKVERKFSKLGSLGKENLQKRRNILKNKEDDVEARRKEKEIMYIGAINVLEGKEFDKPEDIQKLIDSAVRKSECPDAHQPKFKKLLKTFQDILAKKGDPVGLCHFYQPSINLDTKDPIYVPQYPIPHAMRNEVSSSIEQFLEEGIIQYSRSPYNAPTLMVKKKDGGFRMVVDYRKLNLHIITDPFPLSQIAQILENLGGCKYFTTLDLLNGFYNLEIKASDRYKTGFSTHDGHYEFIRLPMGLKNSPSIFQRMMTAVLQDSLGRYAYIYIDDIVVYSKTAKEHLEHLERVLLQLREANL